MPMHRFTILLLLVSQMLPAESRLKELVTVEGVRENQLMGYGIVVGLNGTGDRKQTVFTNQTLTNVLNRMGVTVPPTAIQVANTASVIVTATLPAFAQPGTRIDVNAAAIGDARSLQGGLLLLTPLAGADGQVYAVAQGQVVTGAFVAGGRTNNQTVNHPTSGRLLNGAIVERPAPSALAGDVLRLQLRQADFTTASRIAKAINTKFGDKDNQLAKATSSALVSIRIPEAFRSSVTDFVAETESISIDSDQVAKVVINERTGTVVVGKDVVIQPASILHGALTVEISTSFEVSQPQPLSQGQTTVVPNIGVGVKADPAKHIGLGKGARVDDLVRSLLAIGSTPRDVIAILQALKSAGALLADIEVL